MKKIIIQKQPKYGDYCININDVVPSMKKIDRSDQQNERMVHQPVFKSVPSKSRMTCEAKLFIDVVAAIFFVPINSQELIVVSFNIHIHLKKKKRLY